MMAYALRDRGAEDAREHQGHRHPVPDERRIVRIEVVPRRACAGAHEPQRETPQSGFGSLGKTCTRRRDESADAIEPDEEKRDIGEDIRRTRNSEPGPLVS